MKWLVFSRNRPYQLDAFLSTAKKNAGISPQDIFVLYKYDDEYLECLDTLMKEHEGCTFLEETDFRKQVLDWVSESNEFVSFATDDALFTRAFNSDVIEGTLRNNPAVLLFSLRLGLHLDWCYPTNSLQKVPDGQVNFGVFAWNFRSAEADWGYPLSVDGHVFRKDQLLSMVSAIDFKNPNTLEANLQAWMRAELPPAACCFMKSSYFNSPLNVVQSVYLNRSGNTSVEKLKKDFEMKKRFDTDLCKNFVNVSAHQEFELMEKSE